MKHIFLHFPFFVALLCITPKTLVAQCSTISLITQQEVDNFKVNHPNCTQIQGNLNIGGAGSDIVNLDGLNEVVEVTGQFNIDAAESLVNFKGLDLLASIGGNLRVWNNPVLVNFDGLQSLKSIGGLLSVKANAGLKDFVGLEEIKKLGRLFVANNGALVNFKGLNQLDTLWNISGNIEANGGLVISNNALLQSLSDLSNLKTVASSINLFENPLIVSFDGLDNIDYKTINGLNINNNMMLDNCKFDNICRYLDEQVGPYTITNNFNQCKDVNAVMDACNPVTTSTEEHLPLTFNIFPNPVNTSKVEIQLQDWITHGVAEVINMQGQGITSLDFGQQQRISIDLPIGSGIYWIRIRDLQTLTESIKKVIVTR